MSLQLPPGFNPALVPALAPPPGVVPNFTNPVSRANAVIAANGVITTVMLVFVFARLSAKVAYARSQLGWEDVFNFGFGPHQWNMRLSVLLDSTHIKATNFLYGPMMIFTKLSILLLFFRLFSPSQNTRIWIYVGIVTTLINHVVGTILAITLCIPSDAAGYAHCAGRLNILDLVISAINILSDFYILFLPLFVISKLQMRQNRKLRVLAVFSVGALACASSIVGIIYRVVTWKSPDVSWTLGPLLVASYVNVFNPSLLHTYTLAGEFSQRNRLYEIDIGIIVGCMPIIPLLFKHGLGLQHVISYLRSLPSQLLINRSVSGSGKESDFTDPFAQEGVHETSRHFIELKNQSGQVRKPASVV
ncbi:MAG: hypothetical protein Q9207_003349 [Kuettlingeria erythrocarpa]